MSNTRSRPGPIKTAELIERLKQLAAGAPPAAAPPATEPPIIAHAGVVTTGCCLTYVEDRVLEAVKQRVSENATHAERFMLAKLDEELKRFNTPAMDKSRKLCFDYLAIDVTTAWHWNGVDVVKAKDTRPYQRGTNPRFG